MPSKRCIHGAIRDCKKCRHNRTADASRKRRKMNVVVKMTTWTCGNCGARHNTVYDAICYFCFKPKGF